MAAELELNYCTLAHSEFGGAENCGLELTSWNVLPGDFVGVSKALLCRRRV